MDVQTRKHTPTHICAHTQANMHIHTRAHKKIKIQVVLLFFKKKMIYRIDPVTALQWENTKNKPGLCVPS